MYAAIRAIESYLPERCVSNHELTQNLDTSDEWIYSHTGIRSRYIADPDQKASDLGVEAARKAMAQANIVPDQIDCILVATSTPDYTNFPPTACVIQDKLKLLNASAMDISVACCGFVYGLELARCMVSAGTMHNVLLVASELFSKIVDWQDRSTCVLFGDGAGAAIISRVDDADDIGNISARIMGSTLKSKGDAHTSLTCHTQAEYPYVTMQGRRVYLFAVQAVINSIESLLQKYNMSFDDIDLIIPHQANLRIIEAACQRKKWDLKKFYINIDKYANTSAASIPIAMAELYHNRMLTRAAKIVTVGFGAGFTYGGNYIVW